MSLDWIDCDPGGGVRLAESALYRRLKQIAEDFSCGEWDSPEVLSPRAHFEKAERELVAQPGAISAARRRAAAGTRALVFHGPMARNARGGVDSSRPLEAAVVFTPDEVKQMTDHEIYMAMIGVIAERAAHEVGAAEESPPCPDRRPACGFLRPQPRRRPNRQCTDSSPRGLTASRVTRARSNRLSRGAWPACGG